jgi:predicted nucleic acid-binding protein
MNNILLDTNFLIYSIDEDSKFFSRTQNILENDQLKLFTTSKNISEFLAVITRIPDASISIDNAIKIVRDFETIFSILYPSPISFSILNNLLQKYKPTGLKIHDFEIISIGLAYQVNTIATFNIKDFKNISEINLLTL